MKKAISTKTYTIIEKEYEDGNMCYIRRNKGFSTMELLGHIFLIEKEIYESRIQVPMIVKDKKKGSK